MREEEVKFFLCCISCQNRFPNHFCIITPERPSPCGIKYEEALTRIKFFRKVYKLKKLSVDEYEGVNNFVRFFGCERVKLHSLSFPHPTSPLQQLILFWIPENDGIGIVDRKYTKKTPIGLTFIEMEVLTSGKQVEGFTGASFEYLKSEKFMCGEGGWDKVVWMSPKVKEFIFKI